MYCKASVLGRFAPVFAPLFKIAANGLLPAAKLTMALKYGFQQGHSLIIPKMSFEFVSYSKFASY